MYGAAVLQMACLWLCSTYMNDFQLAYQSRVHQSKTPNLLKSLVSSWSWVEKDAVSSIITGLCILLFHSGKHSVKASGVSVRAGQRLKPGRLEYCVSWTKLPLTSLTVQYLLYRMQRNQW